MGTGGNGDSDFSSGGSSQYRGGGGGGAGATGGNGGRGYNNPAAAALGAQRQGHPVPMVLRAATRPVTAGAVVPTGLLARFRQGKAPVVAAAAVVLHPAVAVVVVPADMVPSSAVTVH
ncbi:hypothetical protein [Shinella oryzae]|uniref:Uncharacterized protein n=1 Tax=Shinella oryzae TaxID=2871820 RepID=A0ABY9KAP2_9HYPH|nr:hypothetical protein [Shinella oryzae]WLS05079.1 hypothetical protein Q9315_23205 [Shinella oryzae]